MIEIFKGKSIDYDKIQRMKDIAYKKYCNEEYNNYFSNITDPDDLAYLHGVSSIDESLVISSDWFLCYAEVDYSIKLLDWISINKENNIQNVIEMLNILKGIFIKNKYKMFTANMKEDACYRLYLKMLENGYFKEISHDIFYCRDNDSNNTSNKCIFHRLNFLLTDKFFDKYIQNEKESHSKVLRINSNICYK